MPSIVTGFPVVNFSAADRTTITQSITVPTGLTNRALAVFTFHERANSGNPTGITANGVALTQKATAAASTWSRCELWTLANPAEGTYNVVATKAAGTGNHWGIAIYLLDTCDQTSVCRTPATASADSGTTASATPAGVQSTDRLVDGVSIDSTGHSPVPGADQTATFATQNLGAGTNESRGSQQAGPAGGVMSWSWTTSAPYSLVAVAFIHDAGGGTPVSQTFSAPYDAPQRLAAAPVAVWEAQQALAGATSGPWDALQGVQAPVGAPYDALQAIAAGTASPWEGIGGLAVPFTSPFEAAGQVVAALAGQWESLAAIAQTVGSPWDAPAGFAQVIVAPFEALAGIGSIAVWPWEAEAPPGLVVAAFALPYENTGAVVGQLAGSWESLSAFNVAFASSWESLLTLANVTGLPVETLAAAAAAFTGPYEARGLVAAALGLPWESIVPGVAAIYPPGHVGYVAGAVAGRVQSIPPAGHVAGSGAGHISN